MRCGNCGRDRGAHRGACECVPVWVWRDPEVVSAVHERDAQRVIQFLRRRVKHLSQEALARMCEVAQSTITRAEAGKGLTDRRKAYEALKGLGALNRQGPEEQASHRGAASPVPSRRLGPPEVPDIEEMVHGLRLLEQGYLTVPSTLVLARAGQLHGRLNHQPGFADHPVVQALLARSCLLMGKVIWDASQRRETHTAALYLDEAIVIARTIGDDHTLAQALLRRSFIPLYSPVGDQNLALFTASRAMATAHEAPSLKALAALHVSEAHARLKHPREAQRYLDAADDFAQLAPDADITTWEGRRLRIAGSVHLELDRPGHAQGLLEQAAVLLRRRPKSHGIVLANLALAHVRQRESDGAVAALHDAMDVAHTTRAGGAMPLISTAVRELTHWRPSPSVAEAQDRFIDLLTR